MSVLRLPFSLSLFWVANTISTPPHPPPRSEERMKFDYSSIQLSARAASSKVFFGLVALGEAILTLASIYPANVWSKNIAFLAGSSPASLNIRLTWSFMAAWLLAISGGVLRRRCYQILGQFFTFELSVQKRHKLVTWGPYAVVRHPSYTGAIMGFLGGSVCFSTPGSWTFEYSSWARLIVGCCWLMTILTVIFSVKRAEMEDKMLQDRFGKEWDLWAKRVPSRLIPGIY